MSHIRLRRPLRGLALAAAVAVLISGCIYGDEEPDSPHMPLEDVWNQTTQVFNTFVPEDPFRIATPTTPEKLNPFLHGCGRRGGAAIPEVYGPPWHLLLEDSIVDPTLADYAKINHALDALLEKGFTEQPPRETADPRERRLTNDDYIAALFIGSQGKSEVARISIESPCFRFDGDTNKDYE